MPGDYLDLLQHNDEEKAGHYSQVNLSQQFFLRHCILSRREGGDLRRKSLGTFDILRFSTAFLHGQMMLCFFCKESTERFENQRQGDWYTCFIAGAGSCVIKNIVSKQLSQKSNPPCH